MPRQKKKPPMPKWIWQLPDKTLNFKQKRFLAFVWWCQDNGCICWNCALERRFKKSRRTIQYWISHLHKLRLINIRYGDGRNRVLFRAPYFKKEVWLLKSSQKPRPRGVQKVAPLDNAKHKSKYKTTYSYAGNIRSRRPTITSKTVEVGGSLRDLPQGDSPPAPPCGSGNRDQNFQRAKKKLQEKIAKRVKIEAGQEA